MKFCEIRILTDENISPKVLTFLRERGIDVIDTKEQNWNGKEIVIHIISLFQEDTAIHDDMTMIL